MEPLDNDLRTRTDLFVVLSKGFKESDGCSLEIKFRFRLAFGLKKFWKLRFDVLWLSFVRIVDSEFDGDLLLKVCIYKDRSKN
jgi:hypothetical protein